MQATVLKESGSTERLYFRNVNVGGIAFKVEEVDRNIRRV